MSATDVERLFNTDGFDRGYTKDYGQSRIQCSYNHYRDPCTGHNSNIVVRGQMSHPLPLSHRYTFSELFLSCTVQIWDFSYRQITTCKIFMSMVLEFYEVRMIHAIHFQPNHKWLIL